MQEKTITILIDENADSSIDLEGFAGSGCGKALDDFRGGRLHALGTQETVLLQPGQQRSATAEQAVIAMLLHALMRRAGRMNGPGLCAVVWFQGCSLGCGNCFNPRTHPFHGTEVKPEHVIREIIEYDTRHDLDGVTFSGGEPMQQATALLTIMRELRRRSPNLSLGMFTGYAERELDEGKFSPVPEALATDAISQWHTIRRLLDFAIMGRYNQAQASSTSLCSSRNQILRLFSGRYTRDNFGPQEVEVIIAEDGLSRISGFPVLGTPV